MLIVGFVQIYLVRERTPDRIVQCSPYYLPPTHKYSGPSPPSLPVDRLLHLQDLCHSDGVPVEKYCHRSDSSLLDSNFDFEFGVNASFEQEPFSADELFSDGKILPREIREKTQNTPPSKQIHQTMRPLPPPPLPPPTFIDDSKKESLKEIMATSTESEEKAPSRSFWPFRRSGSHNFWNGHKRGLICSLPLLPRSKSTGSSTNSKRQTLLKDIEKLSHKPHPPTSPAKSSFASSSSPSQKPPLKKNCGPYGNGVQISPVLNFPHPYIAEGTANLCCLGSLLSTGKDKNKKK